MEVFIALEGYCLPCRFVVKEVCVLFLDGDFDHFLFKAPTNLHLTTVDRRTIRYITAHVNELSYQDGDIPYDTLLNILQKYGQYRIYTYSDIAQQFLQRLLPTTVVINVQDNGFQLPNQLPDPACFRAHPPRYCAKAKVIAIKNFMNM